MDVRSRDDMLPVGKARRIHGGEEVKEHVKVTKRYIFTEKELKEKLGMVGDIERIELWAGRNPHMEETGVPKEKDEWAFTTSEKDDGFKKVDG